MAETKILSLIPESLKDDLIAEVKQLLEEQAQGQQQSTKGVDPSIVAFAQKQNTKFKKQ